MPDSPPAARVLVGPADEPATLDRLLGGDDLGQALFISAKTVSVHVSDVLAELQASSRTEAVALAQRRGLLVPTP